MSVNKVIQPINDEPDDNAAVNLVRSRIEALYEEYQRDHEHLPPESDLTEEFWRGYHNHPNPHQAWKDYYEALSEEHKLKLWQAYHLRADEMSGLPSSEQPAPSATVNQPTSAPPVQPKISDLEQPRSRNRHRKATKKEPKSLFSSFMRNHVWPIVSAALVVSVVWLVFNNELVVAKVKQYVSPGSSNLTPAIIDPSVEVSDESKVIIPKINVDVPVVYDINTFEEKAIQEGLERGVVHYATTGLPGEQGNNVIVGHSSNNFFNGGKYKFAFVLLNRLEIGDTFILHYKGTRYVYRVFNKQVVEPTDFSLIQPTENPIASLVTCDPPGTAWRRLIVQGEQISPDPLDAIKVDTETIDPTSAEFVPGNSPSLWSRFWNWVF